MLQTLRIENFKVLQDVSLRLRRITVLIGPNGSGKSSVLQALALLKQSQTAGGFKLAGPLVSFGSQADIAFLRDTTRTVGFSIEGSRRLPERPKYHPAEIAYKYRFGQSDRRRESTVTLMPGLAQQIEGEYRMERSKVVPAERNFGDIRVGFEARPEIGKPLLATSFAYPPDTPVEEMELLRREVEAVLSTVHEALSDLYFVPASRGIDKNAFPMIDSPATDFASSDGATKQAGDLVSTLAYRRDLERRISEWVEYVTDVRVQVTLIPPRLVSLETARDYLVVNIVNEGSGSNHLVTALAQLAAAPRGGLVMIEEPEIHLHPRAQVQLAELLAGIAVKEQKQLLLTTHSEHLVFGLLTKVADHTLEEDDLGVFRASREAETATVDELPIDDKGRIKGGLSGFFESNLAQFKKYLDALGTKADQ